MKNINFFVSLGLSGIASLSMAQEKPNVLFFLVDDLGWNDISANGSKLYETPNIDEVFNESVYFSNAYSAYPRCVPSRYAMITGRHPARDGQTDGNKIKNKEITIAEALKSHGYGTFFTGKWHLGHTEEFWPHNHGFDVNMGGCDAGSPGSYFFPYGSEKFINKSLYGLEEGEKGEYITDRLTKETLKYIRENHDKTFLAYVAHYAVHTPLQAKKDRIEYYQEKIKKLEFEGEEYSYGPDGRTKLRQDNAIYAAMVESMDDSFGAIIKELKKLGIYDNTIIIFTSDHGGLSNSGLENKRPLATSNLPLRAGKGHIYEGGIKVPMFVHWPGIADKKASSDMIINGMDYFPTILEMCELPLLPDAHIDGKSFVPALKGENYNNDRVFTWHQTSSRPESTGDHNSSVIRQGNFKLHHFLDDNRFELYDLSKDPYEKNNIAKQKRNITKKLYKQLENWKQEANVSSGKKLVHYPVNIPSAQIKSENIEVKLLNGNFEEGAANGWYLAERKHSKAILTDSDDAQEGNIAAKIIVEKADSIIYLALESREFQIPDHDFEISFAAKTSSKSQKLKVQTIRMDNQGNKKYKSDSFILSDTYKSFKINSEKRNDINATSMTIRFQCGSPDVIFYIDEVIIKEVKN